MTQGFLPKTKLSLREVTFLRKVQQLAEAVRDEGEAMKRRIDFNRERLSDPHVPESRSYVGACRAIREILDIAPVMHDDDRPAEEWNALVDRAVEDENNGWIFMAM